MALIREEDFNEDLSQKVAPNGKHHLRITSATLKTSQKTERQFIAFGMQVEDGDGEDYDSVFYNMSMVKDDDEDRTRKMLKRNIWGFCQVFGIPMNLEEDDLPGLVGSEGDCLTKQVERQDKEGNKTGDMGAELVLPKYAPKE